MIQISLSRFHFIHIYFSLDLTFRPLARLMALRGRSTRRTLRIFTTEMADDLERVGMGGGGGGGVVSQVTFYQNSL